jgi:hypothetical protein
MAVNSYLNDKLKTMNKSNYVGRHLSTGRDGLKHDNTKLN